MQQDKKVPDRVPDRKVINDLISPKEPFVSALSSFEERWNWFLGIGVTSLILGIIAIIGAQFTSLATIIFLGIILVAGAITKFIAAFWARQWSGFWLSLIMAALYLVIGFLCLMKPIGALVALTLIISALFLISGISKIVSSLFLRFENWGWVFFSGLVSLLLGILVLAEWPESSLWVIGTFVGVDLVIAGWVWIAFACEARRLAKETGR